MMTNRLCGRNNRTVGNFSGKLYDKTHTKFKDKQKKEGLWEIVAATRTLSVDTVKKWFDMASSHRPSQDKLQPRTPKDRPG